MHTSVRSLLTWAALVLLGFAAAASAQEKAVTFENQDALAGWTVTGNVSIDLDKKREGGTGGTLKIGPGGKAIWKLGSADLSGKVEFWVFDDGTVAAQPKQHGYGALWGLVNKDGQALVCGSLYASYLNGATDCNVGEFDPAKAGAMPSHKCQYLALKRAPGWHKWTFVMDAEKGLSILLDDKDVNGANAANPRFDWNKTQMSGLAGVIFCGDAAKDGKQTLWISNLTVTQGEPMKAKLTPPPPPPPIVPAKDPEPTGAPVKFLDSVAGKHPRILINAAMIPELKARFQSDHAKLYREQILAFIPSCTIPANRKTTDGWGQTVGLFRMPALALHYVLTGDKATFDRCLEFLKWLDETEDWSEGGSEKNSDHAASFTMVGASIMWDWLYNDLDPAFREKFRQTLLYHARYMYYGGHLGGNPGGGYWRGVPGYNHRWYRDWGMTLATLATTEGKPEEQWFLGEVTKELQYMVDWLPADGSQHEGPSYGSSAGALGLACLVSDQCLGTKHLENPFFRNQAAYVMAFCAPGMKESFYFADCFDRSTGFHPFFLYTAARYGQADAMEGLRQFLRINAKKWGTADSMWQSFLWDDPKVTGGRLDRLPTTYFCPDLGIVTMRESWQDTAVGALFKCGPMGGYRLNAWRETKKDAKGALPYLNVAHDHPDANSFTLVGGGEYLAETNRYPLKPGKLSTGNNTILINGLGQAVQGRSEGDEWQQPGNGDMTQMAKVVAYKNAGDVVVVEGEAAGSYLAYTDKATKKSRPAIDRFRRTFIWVKGSYVLIIDDVRSLQPVDITWLMQGAKLETVNEAEGRYRLSKGAATCDFQLFCDTKMQSQMAVSTANDHNKLMKWQQLQATANGTAVRFVSVFDPWHHKDLRVTFTPDGANQATIVVTAGGQTDTWTWQAATGKFEPATLRGSRSGGFNVIVDGTCKPPTEAK